MNGGFDGGGVEVAAAPGEACPGRRRGGIRNRPASAWVLLKERDKLQTTKSLKYKPKKKCTFVQHNEWDYFEESKTFYILEL
ncbi:hypothetical protein NDU88_001383 [Pleurodeles waltl]|uniref:Uncharacterized protein n=1 Tax=Pleurodeles waltl TaxID=8319 RepID=A0AAV7Q2Z0_PLEWA|nr:hypothetical protein NDU88_001383 [Pleurodeles waltl]